MEWEKKETRGIGEKEKETASVISQLCTIRLML
jgi:hypothetical protein